MMGFGKLLILTGLILVLIGLIFSLSDKIPYIGKLPGDIHIKKERFTFYFPITTSILISILLTLFLWLLRR